MGTNQGLARWTPGGGGRAFQGFSVADGLSALSVGALAEDRDGNLWMGTFGSGAMKLAHSGFMTYGAAEGVSFAAAMFLSRNGRLCLVSRPDHGMQLAWFDGWRFSAAPPAWPVALKYFGWGKRQVALQDHLGEWWLATGEGLARFPPVDGPERLAGKAPAALYTKRDGLPGQDVFHLFEDSCGDVWVGTLGPGSEDGLALWNRSTGRFRTFETVAGLPPRLAASAFGEDRAGNVWIGMFHDGGLARYRNGRLDPVRGTGGMVRCLLTDGKGRLWAATSRGLLRIDNPAAESPVPSAFTTREGLSSDYISALTEDTQGRIYAATGRGIDRFEPQEGGLGPIKHFTAADGVVPGELDFAQRDKDGNLWFGTMTGVSQLVPVADRERLPPSVFITGLSVGGAPQRISELGEISVAGLRLSQAPVRIDFVALGFRPGETLRYQYHLKGLDPGWSPPSEQRSVIFASLPPGSYRFQVRVAASDGVVGRDYASLEFAIVPPFWRTWWFLGLCVSAGTAASVIFHRYRVWQAVAVANVRTRIATDLHDDIGASLSQIAILSEVAQRTPTGKPRGDDAPLKEIASISRELVDSMSDIVWAINPEHDRLSNLVNRMRRFANDLLDGRGIHLRFQSTAEDSGLPIGADLRRQLYLILKEALHNIVRHARASHVEVLLDQQAGRLTLEIRDDGQGFDSEADFDGSGLRSMRRRAEATGAGFRVHSEPGAGTSIMVTARVESASKLAVLRGRRETSTR